MIFSDFRKIWFIDFEYGQGDSGLPEPRCLVAKELHSKNVEQKWFGKAGAHDSIFDRDDPNSLIVSFYAPAELSCFLALDWKFPRFILDLFVEFRNLTNGLKLPSGNSLIGALSYFDLPHLDSADKTSMRDLALRGGDYTKSEREALLVYCQSDVEATEALFNKMRDLIDLDRALIRGEYMKSVAEIEKTGIPLDHQKFKDLKHHWEEIQEVLINRIDSRYGVFEGRRFKRDRFERFLNFHKIQWPRHDSGVIDLSDETFRKMTKIHPMLNPLRELRNSLSKMRLSEFSVGRDGRSRAMLSPFRSKTGRNQPSSKRFIFNSSAWIRSLIKPHQDKALAYIDWSQQEFGIAAALSKDEKMMQAYQSGDPYLEFAKLARQIPLGATKKTHQKERSLFKATVLAVQYGMGANSLAQNTSLPLEEAKHLLNLHKRTFKTFWEWSEGCVHCALLKRRIWTTFGWNLRLSGEINPRSLANFPMQANGSEMLRLALILMSREKIDVCAPVHDAVLVEASLREIDEVVEHSKDLMAKASRIVLGGFELKSEANVIRFPNRFEDSERGVEFWEEVNSILNEIRANELSLKNEP